MSFRLPFCVVESLSLYNESKLTPTGYCAFSLSNNSCKNSTSSSALYSPTLYEILSRIVAFRNVPDPSTRMSITSKNSLGFAAITWPSNISQLHVSTDHLLQLQHLWLLFLVGLQSVMGFVNKDPFQLIAGFLRMDEISRTLANCRFGDHEYELGIVWRRSILALQCACDASLDAPPFHVALQCFFEPLRRSSPLPSTLPLAT